MHVVVTGASAGIGEAIVREYLRAGAKVTLVARRKEKLLAIAAEEKGETHVVAADLSDPEAATSWLAEAEKKLGPVDVLINNAGVQNIEATDLADVASGEALLRLNVFTPLRLTRAVLPGMIARGHGTIVDIASMAALTPLPGMFYYNAAKGGLATASEGLRGELWGTGVHVMTVYPGPVDTAMAQTGYTKYEASLSARLAPLGRADTLARMIRKGVKSKRARIIYPRLYGIVLWFPRISRWFSAKFAPTTKRPALPEKA